MEKGADRERNFGPGFESVVVASAIAL